jgi:transposase-like protein
LWFPILEGSNAKKRRRYYSDGLKIAIYRELLAKTDPPVLRRGVSSQVAQKFGVPLRVVQSVWRKGQDYGSIDGVKNKMHKNCGRKRIEIDFEAIKHVPLSERKTFQKLANALGVKKSTLHSRFKEGYFVRTPKT